MFDTIAPRYDLLNRVMTFRLDVRWRRKAIRDLALPPGSLVLDLASGTGDMCIDLRKLGRRPISVDFSFGMLAADRSGAPRSRPTSRACRCRGVPPTGQPAGSPCATSSDLDAFFAELGHVVRPGGRIALLDVDTPRNPVMRWGARRVLRQGRAAHRRRDQRPRRIQLLAAQRRLPPPAATMVASLRRAGFADAAHVQLSGGITQLLTGTRD